MVVLCAPLTQPHPHPHTLTPSHLTILYLNFTHNHPHIFTHPYPHTHTHSQEYVSLQSVTDNSDLGEKLIREGLMRAERRKERRLAKLVRALGTHCHMTTMTET